MSNAWTREKYRRTVAEISYCPEAKRYFETEVRHRKKLMHTLSEKINQTDRSTVICAN